MVVVFVGVFMPVPLRADPGERRRPTTASTSASLGP